MKTQTIFTLSTILLTSINVGLTYLNIRNGRRKEFEDKLFQLKLDAYNEMNQVCYEAIKRLDINSSPFCDIYNFKEKEEWEKHYTENVNEQLHYGFEMRDLIFKYTLIIPSTIISKYEIFTNHCINYVTICAHFDIEMIMDKENKISDLYYDLLNDFRIDLKIDIIDGGLRQRITSKM